jgi:hypothetical protein
VIRFALIGAVLLAAGGALAEPACKGSPDVRECRVFHDAAVFVRTMDGVIAFSEDYAADAPWWRVAGERALPAKLLYDLRRNPTVVVHGDIEACFRTEPAARDETVCIESIANPVVRIPQFD